MSAGSPSSPTQRSKHSQGVRRSAPEKNIDGEDRQLDMSDQLYEYSFTSFRSSSSSFQVHCDDWRHSKKLCEGMLYSEGSEGMSCMDPVSNMLVLGVERATSFSSRGRSYDLDLRGQNSQRSSLP
jgi:hypothetical protein